MKGLKMSNNKWISVAERLPEKDQRVLTWNQIEIQAFTYAGDNKSATFTIKEGTIISISYVKCMSVLRCKCSAGHCK